MFALIPKRHAGVLPAALERVSLRLHSGQSGWPMQRERRTSTDCQGQASGQASTGVRALKGGDWDHVESWPTAFKCKHEVCFVTSNDLSLQSHPVGPDTYVNSFSGKGIITHSKVKCTSIFKNPEEKNKLDVLQIQRERGFRRWDKT